MRNFPTYFKIKFHFYSIILNYIFFIIRNVTIKFICKMKVGDRQKDGERYEENDTHTATLRRK